MCPNVIPGAFDLSVQPELRDAVPTAEFCQHRFDFWTQRNYIAEFIVTVGAVPIDDRNQATVIPLDLKPVTEIVDEGTRLPFILAARQQFAVEARRDLGAFAD